MSVLSNAFHNLFFYNEINKFSGSGGELLVKGAGNASAPSSRIDVGDRLVGIGVAHTVESLSRTPGPDSYRATNSPAPMPKIAARAFQVSNKTRDPSGFSFDFEPLPANDFSTLVEQVSHGAVKLAPETIPPKTMVLSFLDLNPTYTLESISGSPGENWLRSTRGERHWCVGIGKDTDFWAAKFPVDDISLLPQIPTWTKIGSINFGLSLLPGSPSPVALEPVPGAHPSGVATTHDFSLFGTVVGTQGLNTAFPIGLRTEIIFKPLRGA